MGPLHGVRVLEIAGLGPAPFCGMLLADLGAEVVVVERAAPALVDPAKDISRRGKRSVILDLKSDDGRDTTLALARKADVLIEGFRPGVMERLGLGPEVCLQQNPALVYGRMTGWGQHGPLAGAAGHDINYIALTGGLHATGHADRPPVPPVPPAGDFGGGSMFLALGIVSALFESRQSGEGQVIDAAITDGSATLMSAVHSLAACGAWNAQRFANLLDGGAPFYGVYETQDGNYISLGAIEPAFYSLLVEKLELDELEFSDQMGRERWPELRLLVAERIKQRTQAQWCELLEGTDICFAPVLDHEQAVAHPHNLARNTYYVSNGVVQASPAPRFSRTSPAQPAAPMPPGADFAAVMRDWEISPRGA